MENLEKLTSEESAKEKEINEALNSFSEEMMRLEREINNKDIKPWTKEEMQAYLNSGEFKKRIDEYILVNGEKISVANIEMDATTGLLKMKYKVKMDNVEKELTTYLQIAGETNNSYLQFKKNPAAKTEATSVELYENNGKKNLSLDEEYKGGKMFDVNIVKTPSKQIDIRIVENAMKTKEKLMEKIKKYELAPEFTVENFRDETLENTKIETLQYTQLGKEVIAEENTYYRAIFMREGEKYREIGKVYFDEKGEVDTKKTATSQEFKLLGIPMNIAVNTTANTFNIENIDALKAQIKKHREVMSTYIENSEFGDYTIFTGFNRPKGGKWKQTKLLGLELIEDTYTFKRRGDKEKEKINFGFTETNELTLKNDAGAVTEPLTIEIEKSNGKKELRDITKDETKKQMLIQKGSKEMMVDQEKPELKNQPALLTKEYLYNLNEEKLEYHSKKGRLLSSIPATKTEEDKRELGELSEKVQLEDLYKEMKKNMVDKNFADKLKSINLLDNDIYTAFEAIRQDSKLDIETRKCVKVLDDEKNNIYKYYTVSQKKEGDPFIFENDTDLYDEAEAIMKDVLTNINIIEKIEKIQMSYKDKKERKEKTFTQFVGGSGLLPINTAKKIEFLKETNKTKEPLIRTFVRGSKTEDIKNFDIQFNINKDSKITINEKTQTINEQEYKTRLEDKENRLTLRFDDIE